MVHIAGTGVICSIGSSNTECYASLLGDRAGIRPLALIDSVYKDVLPVGEVTQTNQALAERLSLPKPLSRTILLGLQAAREAIKTSGLSGIEGWRTGLISATTVGGMDRTENFFPEFMRDPSGGDLADIAHHACGATTEVIAEHLGITDFITTINTACSSSANAIIHGTRLIRAGMLDVVVAGGTDALTRFTINGFKSLMILDDAPCRPFDADRNGLNLGEGAGYVVLVSDRVLKEESLESLAVVSGFANTNDAFHQTASSPEGRGSYAAMGEALVSAGLECKDIDYINLHGTGTLNNDLSEGTAVRRLFGDKLPSLSSTKSFTGHTLGASGGIEAVFAVMALANQCVFSNLRFAKPIPEVNMTPVTRFEKRKVMHVMSNSFGFGGNSSSIVLSQPYAYA